MDLAALHIFKTVAETGGITKAALRLHRVQSNVTTRVKQLEESLGTPLFHRHKRRLTLSAEGKLLLAYAERLLRLSSEAQAALRNGAPRGTLRIGSLESTAATRLPPVLSRYHAAYPEVRLELVTPRGFPRIRSAKAIGHTPILAFATGCSYRRRLEAWLGGSGIAPERVMEYGSYHAIIACAAAGSGVAVVPRSVIRAVRRDKELRIQTLPQEVARARTLLVWRKGHKSTALNAMQAAIRRSAA